jgi:hypothetical protein
MNFELLEEYEFVYYTKPEFKTFINDKGELKKSPENYQVKRNLIDRENMYHYINPNHKLCGIFTGKISNLTVIDIDSKEIYNKLIEEHPKLKKVFTVETLNGYHLYFAYDPDIKGTLTNVFNKYNELGEVDIRNDNDIITAPQSTYNLLNEKNETFTYKYLYGVHGYQVAKCIKKLLKPSCFFSNDKKEESEEEEEQSKKKYNDLTDEQLTKIIDLIDDEKADNYETWIKAGFALYDYLKEDGRSYYHDFSKKSDKYNKIDVNKQYDTLKKSNKKGITIATLLSWAKEADEEEYKKIFPKSKLNNNNEFWEMMKLFNNHDIAKYYKSITTQRFIFSKNVWYGYNEYNVISELSEKAPTQLISNISEVLQIKLKEEIKKIEPDDKIYDNIYKLFKSCYKSVGTSSFVHGTLSYLQTFYNDDNLREKLDNNNNLLAFNDKVFDFSIKKVRNIEMNDFISITTGYNYPKNSNPTIKKEITDLIYSVFENNKMAKYWLESVSMAIHTNKFENFYIHSGSGRNGKGLLFSLVESALGKYILTADSEFLTTRLESGKPNPILTKGKGKRLMMITEPSTEDNKKEIKLNVDLIKKLSGLDKIEARDLFQKSKDVIQYTPFFTCVLQCNQKPELGKIDNGIKERLKIVEYPFTFVDNPKRTNERQKDMNLKDKLLKEAYINEMILLLIETVNNFNKFEIPIEVNQANQDFIDSCDPSKEWLFQNYDIIDDNTKRIRTSELLNKFKEENNIPMTASKFINLLKIHNVNTKIKDGNNYFVGIIKKVVINDLDQ